MRSGNARFEIGMAAHFAGPHIMDGVLGPEPGKLGAAGGRIAVIADVDITLGDIFCVGQIGSLSRLLLACLGPREEPKVEDLDDEWLFGLECCPSVQFGNPGRNSPWTPWTMRFQRCGCANRSTRALMPARHGRSGSGKARRRGSVSWSPAPAGSRPRRPPNRSGFRPAIVT